jgi:formylmethanofuran dehydrogenase subunit A
MGSRVSSKDSFKVTTIKFNKFGETIISDTKIMEREQADQVSNFNNQTIHLGKQSFGFNNS